MPDNLNDHNTILTTIAPWLSVRNSQAAVAFYKAAFGATENFRLEAPEHGNFSPATVGGGTVRIILTVANPEAFFSIALEAGATQVFPVSEDYGWKLGRLVDPFGHHREIGHQIDCN